MAAEETPKLGLPEQVSQGHTVYQRMKVVLNFATNNQLPTYEWLMTQEEHDALCAYLTAQGKWFSGWNVYSEGFPPTLVLSVFGRKVRICS